MAELSPESARETAQSPCRRPYSKRRQPLHALVPCIVAHGAGVSPRTLATGDSNARLQSPSGPRRDGIGGMRQHRWDLPIASGPPQRVRELGERESANATAPGVGALRAFRRTKRAEPRRAGPWHSQRLGVCPWLSEVFENCSSGMVEEKSILMGLVRGMNRLNRPSVGSVFVQGLSVVCPNEATSARGVSTWGVRSVRCPAPVGGVPSVTSPRPAAGLVAP